MRNSFKLSLVIVSLFLLGLFPLFTVNLSVNAASSTISNPSVILGSQAALNGPRVSALKYYIFSSDHSSLQAVQSGETNIMDFPPGSLSDTQAALADSNLNVTSQTGTSLDQIYFNNYNGGSSTSAPSPLVGANVNFRQAIEHLINFTYVQDVVEGGVLGVASPNNLLPSAWGAYSTNSITTYPFGLTLANQSLARDSQLAYSATAKQPSGTGFACNGGTGAWEFAGSNGLPNGTIVEPKFVTRSDFNDIYQTSQAIWNNAAQIGLCFNLEPVGSFAAADPIVFAAYSYNWDMYMGGVSFSIPLNPVNTLFEEFTASPGWTTPFFNTGHYYNSTIESLLHQAYTDTNITSQEAISRTIVQDLSTQIPLLPVVWVAVTIPSLNQNPTTGQMWAGYVNVPLFSTWTFASNEFTILNAHIVNTTTGGTETGGTFAIGERNAPENLNAFQGISIYDFDILGGLYDSPLIFNPAQPDIAHLVPWMLTSLPTVQSNVNMTTPHGYKMVNGMVLTMNFMKNITFADNVPMTANDYNFSLWVGNPTGASYSAGTCSAPCWTKYVNNSANDYTGAFPNLLDSQVSSNNPYSETVYLNASDNTDYLLATTQTVFPEHLWQNINSSYFSSLDATTATVNGASLETGTGPFYFSTYVHNQYVLENRNPGYFRTDIKDWALNVKQGSSLPLSVNLTLSSSGA